MDLLSKAEEYRRRAAHLRKIARAVHAVRAHEGLIQAAATWEQLAAVAVREAAWQKQINGTGVQRRSAAVVSERAPQESPAPATETPYPALRRSA